MGEGPGAPFRFPAAVDVQALWRTGARALRAGDAGAARADFQRIVDAGRGDGAVWLGLAMATRALGDEPAMLAALDAALAIEPRDMRALMMKGDHFAAKNDAPAASSFYNAVARLGDERAASLPPDLAADAARAREALARYAHTYAAHLEGALKAQGLGAPGTRRIQRSLDLLLGRATIYPQQPRFYYFPELPQIEVFPREQLPWMDAVEAAAGAIREELLGVLTDDAAAFAPYIEGAADRPFFDDHGMRDNPEWSAFYLWKNGEIAPENAGRCPRTMAALEAAPLCRIPGRTPSVLFSLLRPGAHIPPHHGFMNARLICHLPLIVPGDGALRVGNETVVWEEGRGFAFDDTIEHEAWNRSDRLRVVLIFDVWRPELTEVERGLVGAALEAIDSFGGGRTELGT